MKKGSKKKHTVTQSSTPPLLSNTESIKPDNTIREKIEKLNISSSIKQWTPDDFLGSDVISILNETKDIPVYETISNFKKNMVNYPQYVSYETATVLNVAVALENEVLLNNLPDDDKKVIHEQLDKQENSNIIREKFTVKLDGTKDFELIFKVTSKLENEDENEDEITEIDLDKLIKKLESAVDHPTNDKTVTIRLFNAVIHPKIPVSTYGIPIKIDGELFTSDSPPAITIENNNLNINTGSKDRFQHLAGISTDKPKKTTEDIGSDVKRIIEPNIGKNSNRNAYEIRLSTLELAASSVGDRDPDKILDTAKKFYKFVENK